MAVNYSGKQCAICEFLDGEREDWMHQRTSVKDIHKEGICTNLILILNQPIDKSSAIISPFCVKLP